MMVLGYSVLVSFHVLTQVPESCDLHQWQTYCVSSVSSCSAWYVFSLSELCCVSFYFHCVVCCCLLNLHAAPVVSFRFAWSLRPDLRLERCQRAVICTNIVCCLRVQANKNNSTSNSCGSFQPRYISMKV